MFPICITSNWDEKSTHTKRIKTQRDNRRPNDGKKKMPIIKSTDTKRISKNQNKSKKLRFKTGSDESSRIMSDRSCIDYNQSRRQK